MKNFIKGLILSFPYFWYVEEEWEWSYEWDYYRKPRQFLKNRIYKEYMITSIFNKTPYSKEQAVVLFMKAYDSNNLFEDRLAVIQNISRK